MVYSLRRPVSKGRLHSYQFLFAPTHYLAEAPADINMHSLCVVNDYSGQDSLFNRPADT